MYTGLPMCPAMAVSTNPNKGVVMLAIIEGMAIDNMSRSRGFTYGNFKRAEPTLRSLDGNFFYTYVNYVNFDRNVSCDNIDTIVDYFLIFADVDAL